MSAPVITEAMQVEASQSLARAMADLDRVVMLVKGERDQAVRILRMLVEAASADKLEDYSRTSNVADMAAGFLHSIGEA